MKNAPIALFVFNRPVHTRRTVEALLKNELANESDLYIFSDAPGSPETAEAVREVREYIKLISGFRSVRIVEREKNLGLSNSIIEGVTSVINEHGRIIVLEDDLVTSPQFLRFLNDALELYKLEDQVMHISGSVYPIERLEIETFFLRVPLCWGWGTWDRAWRHFSKNNDVMLKFDRQMRSDFSFNNSYHYWEQLELNKKGVINTWFVYWYAALFLRGGLALFPGRSLVKNIGFDGTGTHCGSSNFGNDVEPAVSGIRVAPIPLKESAEVVTRHEVFFRHDYRPSASFREKLFRNVILVLKRLILSIRSVLAVKK
ncbi:MAG: glycosyltransferase [Sideroxyarcus sp.]